MVQQWFSCSKAWLVQLECMTKQSCPTVHTQISDAVAKMYHADRDRAKSTYYNKWITDATSNQATLIKIADKLLHSSSAPVFPSYALPQSGWWPFIVFHWQDGFHPLLSLTNCPWPDKRVFSRTPCHLTFSAFITLSVNDVHDLIKKFSIKSCPLDPIPADLFRVSLSTLIPALTPIVNHSLEAGCFPSSLKHAQLSPIFKKLTTTLSHSKISAQSPTWLTFPSWMKER